MFFVCTYYQGNAIQLLYFSELSLAFEHINNSRLNSNCANELSFFLGFDSTQQFGYKD